MSRKDALYLPRGLAALIAVAVSLTFTSVAAAQQTPPIAGDTLGLEVKRIDAAARTLEAVQHCTDPASAGKLATFRVAGSVDISRIPVNTIVGVRLDRSSTPVTILDIVPPPCEFRPGAPAPSAGPGGDAGPGGLPAFASGFLSRVWRFQGEVDGFEDGKLSYTIGKVLNLPRKMRAQDDELLDQDAIVLVGRGVRVSQGGKRVSSAALADAEGGRARQAPAARQVAGRRGRRGHADHPRQEGPDHRLKPGSPGRAARRRRPSPDFAVLPTSRPVGAPPPDVAGSRAC
jgi:hypothetical protein